MRILITGATGFIGRRLCEALLRTEHEVVALVRPRRRHRLPGGVHPVNGDVTVAASMPPALDRIDAVIHLAGVTHASQASTFDRVNFDGTRNLFAHAAGRSLRRFVHVSSMAVLGPSTPDAPHAGRPHPAPINAYGRSKRAAEEAILERAGELPLTVLRPAIVYGPGDPRVLAWVRMLRRRLMPMVPDLQLSFLHVDDLVDLLVRVVEDGPEDPGPYLLSDDTPRRMDAVVDLVEQALGDAPALRVPLGRGLVSRVAPWVGQLTAATGVGRFAARTLAELAAPAWTCTSDEARTALGFAPRHDLLTALPQTVRWYREAGWLES